MPTATARTVGELLRRAIAAKYTTEIEGMYAGS